MKEWRAFMKKYYPEGEPDDASNVYGYPVAQPRCTRCSSSAATT